MTDSTAVLGIIITTFLGLLGALVGSFSNVVIWRAPRGESVVWPGSRCPKCGRRLGALELVPVLSWLFQRGRCRGCGEGISARYPLIEALMAAGYVIIALRWPPLDYGGTLLPLLAVFTMLVILTFIDLDTLTLPDSITLPALVVALAGTFLYATGSGLPTLEAALAGAGIGAGILVAINRLGGLAMRRFRDTRERLWPIGFDQVNLAALAGLAFGWQLGLAAAGASLLLNLVTRRVLRLPENVSWLLWLLVFVAVVPLQLVLPLPQAVAGSLIAAGWAALAGAVYWWIGDLLGRVPKVNEEDDPAKDEPIAMGFGDVKLAAVLGALLGWESLLVALLLAVLLGAVIGVIGRIAGGERTIPFGPYLVAGALIALFFGPQLIAWYTGLLQI